MFPIRPIQAQKKRKTNNNNNVGASSIVLSSIVTDNNSKESDNHNDWANHHQQQQQPSAPECMIHIGLPKTGTTTVQGAMGWNLYQHLIQDNYYYLGKTKGVAHKAKDRTDEEQQAVNKDEFMIFANKRQCLFPRTGATDPNNNDPYHHHYHHHHHHDDDDDEAAACYETNSVDHELSQQFIHQLQEHYRSGHNIIISEEFLSALVEDKLEYLALVLNQTGYGNNVRLVVTSRYYYEWVISWIQQYFRSGTWNQAWYAYFPDVGGAYLPTIMEFVQQSSNQKTFHTYCNFDECDWDYVNGIDYDKVTQKGNITSRIQQQQADSSTENFIPLPPALSLLKKFERYFPNRPKNPHKIFQFNQPPPPPDTAAATNNNNITTTTTNRDNHLVTHFICQTLPQAHQTCRGLQNGTFQIPPQLNAAIPRVRMDYEYILQEAYEKFHYSQKCAYLDHHYEESKFTKRQKKAVTSMEKLKHVIKPASYLRKEISLWMRQYHHYTISGCHRGEIFDKCPGLKEFPLLCISWEEKAILVNKTIQFEKVTFPETFTHADEVRIRTMAWENMKNNSKYCVPNVQQTLQDPQWIEFFESLLPKKLNLRAC